MSVVIKSQEEVGKMRLAGRLASEVLDYISPYVKPGVTTGKLNDLCHTYMVGVQGTVPAPLNYAPPGYKPFPKSICTSVNHQVCHGIPGDRVLKPGDALNIDVTVIKDGFHGDSSRMFHIGEPGIQARRLVDITYECMWRGIAQVRPGAHWATSVRRSSRTPSSTATPSCANSAATASAAGSMRNPRSCITAGPGPA
jgi:methionyl aminopeptidase